ncbi:MAG: hypothetical protein DRI30_03700 [Chloroflexi bacterium]|nr:MAG: hypothetical protein DRI30_03700 [Chloroflexota bacterium]
MSEWRIGKPRADKSLQDHINWYVKQSYHVQSQTETSVQLVNPKRPSLYLYVEDGKVKSL